MSMNVSELREALKHLPQDQEVLVGTTSVYLHITDVTQDKNPENGHPAVFLMVGAK